MTSKSTNDSILHSPAATPPPGVISNLDNPPNQGVGAHAPIITLSIVCSSLVIARVYTKRMLIRKVSLSDYAIILTWASFIPFLSICWLYADLAPGIGQWNLTLQDFSALLYYIYIASVIYVWSMMFLKISILLQIMEIFVPLRQPTWFYLVCLALIVANMIYYLIGFFVSLYACQPRERMWTPWMTEGSCLDTIRLDLITASINSASDYAILILPQLRIWKLHMSWSDRGRVSVVFLVGALACIASTLRLYHGIQYADSNNISYYWFISGLCSMSELSVGIIVACLPSMPRLFRDIGIVQCLSRIKRRLAPHGVFVFRLHMRPRFPSGLSLPGSLRRKRTFRSDGMSQTSPGIVESDQELPLVTVSRDGR